MIYVACGALKRKFSSIVERVNEHKLFAHVFKNIRYLLNPMSLQVQGERKKEKHIRINAMYVMYIARENPQRRLGYVLGLTKIDDLEDLR